MIKLDLALYTVASINLGRQNHFGISPLLLQIKNFACLITANVNKISIKKIAEVLLQTFKIMAPISYFNRVKIISLIETDVSEARVTIYLLTTK
jgi:hypothetical protein